jgi:cathepsin L
MGYSFENPIELESDYPYVAQDGKCTYDRSKGVVSAKSYTNVTPNSSAQLKAAIAKTPVAISIQADQPVYHQYTGGIITSSDCGTDTDHAVLAVGYGSENGVDYFLVKNSWGPAWGENGYVRLGMAPGAGICGCQHSPIFAQSS